MKKGFRDSGSSCRASFSFGVALFEIWITSCFLIFLEYFGTWHLLATYCHQAVGKALCLVFPRFWARTRPSPRRTKRAFFFCSLVICMKLSPLFLWNLLVFSEIQYNVNSALQISFIILFKHFKTQIRYFLSASWSSCLQKDFNGFNHKAVHI